MRVRMNIGPKAGEIQDIVFAQAKRLVEIGQAEDVDNQMNLAKPKVTRVDALSIATHKKKRK